MSETGSHVRREAAMQPGSGVSTTMLPAAPPVSPDDRTVISTRPPVPIPTTEAVTQILPTRSLLGQRLDHFELLEYVGGGGMGVVFKALDTRLNRTVALKVLSRDQADEEEKVRRFQNEAQSAARLDHDHIARVYFVGQDRGLHYIVFEYIEGVNLREMVARDGPLPLDAAISYTLQVAEALAHAASRDVVHRDIKPSNVLITPQGRAKLVDMGLARLHQVEPSENDLTSSGVTLGTFDYISPEQARDPRNADVRSDIYSLGCTLYYMLTARPPFPDGNVLQKLLQHNNDPPPDPVEFNPELPEPVSKLVKKMLAKDPRRRHQTAGELVADLLVLIDQLGLPTGGIDPLAWSIATPPRIIVIERHLPWAAPLLILIVTVLVLEYVWRPSTEAYSNVLPPRPNIGQPANGNGNDAVERIDGATGRQGVPTPGRASTAVTPPSENGHSSTGAEKTVSTQDTQPPAPATVAAEQTVNNAATTSAAEQANGSQPAGRSATDVEPTARAAPAVAPKSGVRVVRPLGPGPREYASVRQACADAASNDVIELHFSGLLEEKPFRLNNKKLTIRAGDGFRPTIAFRLVGSEPQAMLTVVGGQLSLYKVALEVEIPTRWDPPSWALFQTQRAESIRLHDCWLTIRNATEQHTTRHPFVAFFDIKAPPDAAAMAMEHAGMGEHNVSIQLTNCVARGEATLLRCDDLQPVSLSWQNGLFASSERLLVVHGGEMANKVSGQVSVDLQHVTANMRGGLCLIANDEGNRPLLLTELQCSNSILLAGSDASLVDETGVESVEDFEGKVRWAGNRYFYTGFNTFWRIASFAAGQPSQDPVRRTFDHWQKHWGEGLEKQEDWSRVVWKKLPDASRAMNTHTPADYALDDAVPENRAHQGATDGTDAGLQMSDLSAVPLTTPVELPPAVPTHSTPAPPEDEQ